MKTLLIVLFFVSICFSQEATTYIVYMSKLPDTIKKIDFPTNEKLVGFNNIINLGVKDIKVAGGQPFRLTHYLRASNTNYALISLVPKDDWDKKFIDKCIGLGLMKKYKTEDVITVEDRRVGGRITKAISEKFCNLPTDFNYVVGISSK